jgi:histidine kinase
VGSAISNAREGDERQTDDDLLLALIHDIRQHLRKSVTRAQMLERQAYPSLAPELQVHLDEILSAGREMDILLSRLAQYAVAGSVAQHKTSGDLGVMFDSALRRLASKNVEAEIDSSPIDSRTIRAPYPVETVLRELLDNALKFRQGPVKISLLVEQLPEKNVVGIKDTGIGFDPQYGEKIMRPLERLHPASVYPGSGLGLAICQRTIESWGGTIWAESSLGGGSTFWFSLPA